MSVAGLGQVIVGDFLDHSDTLVATTACHLLWLHRLEWVRDTRQNTPLVERPRYRGVEEIPSVSDIVIFLYHG